VTDCKRLAAVRYKSVDCFVGGVMVVCVEPPNSHGAGGKDVRPHSYKTFQVRPA
jgi:hypothetical protein